MLRNITAVRHAALIDKENAISQKTPAATLKELHGGSKYLAVKTPFPGSELGMILNGGNNYLSRF